MIKNAGKRDNTEVVAKRRRIKHDTKWKVRVQEALKKRGIDKPFALWQKIGGSKQTATDIWNGNITMIRLETFDRLDEVFNISPYEILVKTKGKNDNQEDSKTS